jgi:molybdate transport system permease protein
MLADEILVLDGGRALQCGATRDVFERPANRKVAELLGIDNVGEGTLLASGTVDIGGVLVDAGTGGFLPGTRVMWRVDADGVSLAEGGRYAGVIERVYGSYGETRVAVRVGAALLHCSVPARGGYLRAVAGIDVAAAGGAPGSGAGPDRSRMMTAGAGRAFARTIEEGQSCCIDIAPGSVTVWPVSA